MDLVIILAHNSSLLLEKKNMRVYSLLHLKSTPTNIHIQYIHAYFYEANLPSMCDSPFNVVVIVIRKLGSILAARGQYFNNSNQNAVLEMNASECLVTLPDTVCSHDFLL